jgi:NADPH:quinone reductase-like Zn-dependent oxidoreductase
MLHSQIVQSALVRKINSATAERRREKKAKRLNVSYSFLFMRAEGDQLHKITSLIDAGIIKPVVDKGFPFEQTNEAMAYVETGRAKGKVVIKIK